MDIANIQSFIREYSKSF